MGNQKKQKVAKTISVPKGTKYISMLFWILNEVTMHIPYVTERILI